MSNNNFKNDNNRKDTYREESNESRGPKIPAVMFNTLGLTPNSVTFYLNVDDLKNYVKEFASTKLDGVFDVTIVAARTKDDGRKERIVYPKCFLWLKADSDELVDKSAKGGDSIIWCDIPTLSNNLKTFAINYCVDGKNLRFVNSDDNRDLKGIVIDLGKILGEIFDQNNKEFKKNNPGAKSNNEWNISVKTLTNRDNNITGLEVTKRRNNPHKSNKQIMPRENGKF